VGMAALAAAAAVAVAFAPQLRAPSAPAAAPAAPLAVEAPRASAVLRALVDAQAAAVKDPEAPLDALAAATAPRRRELFAGLEERFGGPP
jgi:hypothetical protein